LTQPKADKGPSSRQTPFVRIAVFLPLALLAVLSFPFIVSDLDLTLHKPFYDAATNSWPSGEAPIWRFFYTVGPIPAILLGVASIFTLLLGIGNPKLAKYRRVSAYFFFVLLIGSGLITNAILKDQWGRPRPKQITAFDGTEKFERLLHYEPESTGKSFPCGHATVGFFFLAFVPILTGRRRWWLLIFSLLFGTLIGIARITQGGHFTSDVIWAAAVMWFTSLAFYKLFKLDQSLWWHPRPGAKATPRWVPWVSAPLVILLVGLAGTIWPYDKELRATPQNLPEELTLETLLLDFNGEDIIEIVPGEAFTITCFTDGHRAPKSRLRPSSTFTQNPPTVTVDFKRQGFFTELNVRTVVTVPPEMQLTVEGTDELTRIIIPQEGLTPTLELSPQTKILRR
jgi:membrane-associated PAP2 superfamily phosphatase